ncbi:unnamed protein product [Aphanomyces euteiches]|uniref:Pentacotripeptide-repeat region of PRORP domain-containing protein n=1 Tax=Aphanomyces euteiches TaxID=100861 RepID=A0A6G0XRY5_9STRA|nr:hypothetical protein Ae201684_002177 [Aphanomyces euteiches]KAH9086649.1 hypothetical protein Ae201684P_000071 [Aphanomyces euteiches]KAH9131736.1 hypothetical protein AeRB84_021665 [Aphanomyces euteiches]
MIVSRLSRSGVRAFSSHVPFVLPEFPVLLDELERDGKEKRYIKVSKLTNLFKQVTTKDELEAATQAFKIFERKHIDPVENTAGEFVKASLKQDAADVALNALSNNFRIGLFFNTGMLNKLLAHFESKQDDASIVAAFESIQKFEVAVNATTYQHVISALIRSGDSEKAVELAQVAASHGALNEATKALVDSATAHAVEEEVATEEGAAAEEATSESNEKPPSA